MRILVVDDALPVRLALVEGFLFVRPHADIRHAADLSSAVVEMRSSPIDLVAFDMVMGTPDAGLEVLKAATSCTPRPKTLLVTGLPREDPRVGAALDLGVDGVMRKPIQFDKLDRALASIEAGRQHLDFLVS